MPRPESVRDDRRPARAALPVGWAENVAPALFRCNKIGWADGQRIKRRGAGLAGPARRVIWLLRGHFLAGF